MRVKTFLVAILVFSVLNDVSARPAIRPLRAAAPIVCGRRPLLEDPFSAAGSRIVGGNDALPGSWPWLVSIQQPLDYEGRDFAHTCGGTIVNQQWVLTAAHCFKGVGSDYLEWRLVLGARQLSNLASGTQIRKIIRKIEHEKYNPDTEENDIALLRMDRPVTFSNYIQPACLPQKDTVFNHLSECYIAGWGVTSEDSGEPADVLQQAQVHLIETKKCNSTSWYNGAIRNHNLCAGHEKGGIDSCQGDSGGPLMCRRPQTKTIAVIGITSWGWGCAQAKSPGVYSSAQSFLDWTIAKITI
ncbi:acrosin-like [Pyxicephalus adspersus]